MELEAFNDNGAQEVSILSENEANLPNKPYNFEALDPNSVLS